MKVAVVVPRPRGYVHAAALLDLAEPLCEGLKANGIDAELVSDWEGFDRVVVVGPHLLDRKPPEDAILYNTEQVSTESSWFEGPLLDLYLNHRVWDYDPMNTTALCALGVDVVTVPPGYAPSMTRVERKVEPDIDVLFFGSSNDRRTRILNELSKRALSVNFAFGLYGAERDGLIARSKIVLNVHYYEAQIFEAARVSYLLANRAFVVSEMSTYMPWSDGYIAAPYTELVETCREWLSSDRRRDVAGRGFETFSRQTAADMVRPVYHELVS